MMATVRHHVPPLADIVLSCVLAVLALLELLLNDDVSGPRSIQVAALVTMVFAVAFRRSAPMASAIVIVAAIAAAALAGVPLTDGMIPLVILGFAIYAVARADVLEDEMDEYTERATLVERERIARELHDVVAHRLSTIAVQAGAGLHVLHEDPEQARSTFEAIDETARSGLSEMRQALGLLRARDAGAVLAPQPSLRELPRLAQEARDAGVPVDLRVSGDTRALPAGLDLSAYRIVQEALTNVRRHAPGASATVEVCVDERSVRLQIADAGGTASGNEPSEPGHGLVGIRERVALYGGSFDAGPEQNGFRVRATLPVDRAAR